MLIQKPSKSSRFSTSKALTRIMATNPTETLNVPSLNSNETCLPDVSFDLEDSPVYSNDNTQSMTHSQNSHIPLPNENEQLASKEQFQNIQSQTTSASNDNIPPPTKTPLTQHTSAESDDGQYLTDSEYISEENNPDYVPKLFVGQIPRHFVEADLLPMFSQVGNIREFVILRSFPAGSSNGTFSYFKFHLGCAFLHYTTKEAADKCIETFHQKIQLDQAKSLLQVKYREIKPHKEGPNLFVGQLGPSVTEEDLAALFSPFGKVKDVTILRDKVSRSSKQCGFVNFYEPDACRNAIQSLNGYIPKNSKVPMTVNFVRSRKKTKSNSKHPGSQSTHHPRHGNSLFDPKPSGPRGSIEKKSKVPSFSDHPHDSRGISTQKGNYRSSSGSHSDTPNSAGTGTGVSPENNRFTMVPNYPSNMNPNSQIYPNYSNMPGFIQIQNVNNQPSNLQNTFTNPAMTSQSNYFPYKSTQSSFIPPIARESRPRKKFPNYLSFQHSNNPNVHKDRNNHNNNKTSTNRTKHHTRTSSSQRHSHSPTSDQQPNDHAMKNKKIISENVHYTSHGPRIPVVFQSPSSSNVQVNSVLSQNHLPVIHPSNMFFTHPQNLPNVLSPPIYSHPPPNLLFYSPQSSGSFLPTYVTHQTPYFNPMVYPDHIHHSHAQNPGIPFTNSSFIPGSPSPPYYYQVQNLIEHPTIVDHARNDINSGEAFDNVSSDSSNSSKSPPESKRHIVSMAHPVSEHFEKENTIHKKSKTQDIQDI